MLIYVKFCTNQSGRQLSPCYSRPWFLKSSFVSLAVCLFFRIVLFLCMTVPCNQTSSYGIFFMGREKRFSASVMTGSWAVFSIFLLQAEFTLFRNCPGNVRSKWTNLSILSLFLLVTRGSQFLEQILFQIPAKSFLTINLS